MINTTAYSLMYLAWLVTHEQPNVIRKTDNTFRFLILANETNGDFIPFINYNYFNNIFNLIKCILTLI